MTRFQNRVLTAVDLMCQSVEFVKNRQRAKELDKAPSCFCCPITNSIMSDPVITPAGISFDRSALVEWLKTSPTNPISREPLTIDQLYPNLSLREQIESWHAKCASGGGAAPNTQTPNGESSSTSFSAQQARVTDSSSTPCHIVQSLNFVHGSVLFAVQCLQAKVKVANARTDELVALCDFG